MLNDQDIILGIRNGEESAFKALVDQYQELVINVCHGFVHNREDALDISQDVFIKAFDSIGQFRSQSKLSTWLYRIAVNRPLNFIRDKKRKNIFSSLDILFDPQRTNPVENESDPEDRMDEKMEKEERLKVLHQALDTLPRKQKVALTLNKLEGLSYKQIAEIMDISVSETGVLINRARKKLQSKLTESFKKQSIV